jgi:hypothetical protein
VAASSRKQRNAIWMAGAAAAALLLAAPPAVAQSLLRGTTDEDPIIRIGRTSGEGQRNPATPAGRRTTPDVQLGTQDTLAGQPAASGPRTGPNRRATRRGAARRTAQRPAQQNFRSLEKPLNAAVTAPSGDQNVNQGLPPPPPQRRNGRSVEDPYAPLGLRLGTLSVFPTLEVSSGFDSNPARTADGLQQRKKGSAVVRTEAGFTARSDWSRHEINADVKAGYSRYPSVKSADRPDATVKIGGRFDVSKDTAIDAELRGRLDSQTPGSANLTSRAEGRPLTYQYGASLGGTQRFNRLAVSLRGTVDRSEFEDASTGNGQKLSQKDRQFTQYGLRLRTGYEISPGIIPFAEALIDTRRYDLKLDSQGYQRDSAGVQLRAGSTFEFTRTLTGEVLAGYGLRRFEDNRLRDLRGPVVEAALSWAVSPLTTVRLRGTTEFEETTLTGSSGSITRRLSADLSHAFLRNLVFNAGASFARADYNGISRKDDTLRATLGVDYSLTRNLVLKGSFAHERTTSTTPGNNISSNIWLFGAKLQY